MCDEPSWTCPGFGVFYLRPLNDRAQAVIENPKNKDHVRLSRTNERVLSVGHVRSTRGEHRTTLTAIGLDADIVVDGCSIAKIQCSFEIDIEKGLLVFYDRSHLQTSNVFGPCATPFQPGSPRNITLLAGTDTIIGMGGPQSTHVMFELVWYDDRYRTVVSHLYGLHMKDGQQLSRMPTINDAADKTLLSEREVKLLENESVSKEQRRLENRKWHLIWRHQASFPANQFKAEVKAELDNPEIRQEANRSRLDDPLFPDSKRNLLPPDRFKDQSVQKFGSALTPGAFGGPPSPALSTGPSSVAFGFGSREPGSPGRLKAVASPKVSRSATPNVDVTMHDVPSQEPPRSHRNVLGPIAPPKKTQEASPLQAEEEVSISALDFSFLRDSDWTEQESKTMHTPTTPQLGQSFDAPLLFGTTSPTSTQVASVFAPKPGELPPSPAFISGASVVDSPEMFDTAKFSRCDDI
ncbi:hypothetical protein B0T24DRAFT_675888 [Lasiosphaeria ovina]|uniref:FHA domain-containing protein n=1 Tax=Lasiosphaeria ovina TaxID=92902 RepID=A0AAE0NEU6_9PEZI|nr:hypothetical protein B0T24DRAFT_675888 [Lasiosphaeria ovina]